MIDLVTLVFISSLAHYRKYGKTLSSLDSLIFSNSTAASYKDLKVSNSVSVQGKGVNLPDVLFYTFSKSKASLPLLLSRVRIIFQNLSANSQNFRRPKNLTLNAFQPVVEDRI